MYVCNTSMSLKLIYWILFSSSLGLQVLLPWKGGDRWGVWFPLGHLLQQAWLRCLGTQERWLWVDYFCIVIVQMRVTLKIITLKWRCYFCKLNTHTGMNTLIGYDLVPEPKILDSALRACRRLNDLASAIRILEAVKVCKTHFNKMCH